MDAKLVLAVALAATAAISPATGQEADRPVVSEGGVRYELWDTNELLVVLGKSMVPAPPLDPSMYGRRIAFAGLTKANACRSASECFGMQIWFGQVGSLYGYFRPGDEPAQYRQMASKCPLGNYNYCATLVFAELVHRAGVEEPQIEVTSTKYSSYRYGWAPGTVTKFSVAPQDVIKSFNLRVESAPKSPLQPIAWTAVVPIMPTGCILPRPGLRSYKETCQAQKIVTKP